MLELLQKETELELSEILGYWITHTRDLSNGGFVGKIGTIA